tara:strand:- start:4352 stop:5941 length:1590 start_codon:yes stop_codon:yes gene_type:complete
MAYKFQMGDARLSGSVRQEGTIRADQKISSSADLYGLQLRTGGTVRIDSAGALSNIGAITQAGGSVTLDGAADTAIDLAADSLYFRDADGTMKREAVSDIATGMAGVGLAASSGVFSVDLNELSAGAIASGDSLAFVDANDSNNSKKETVDDLATLFAGDGLGASSAVLAVNVDGSSIEINSDALRVKAAGITDAMLNDDVATGLAGVGLSAASGVMALDLNELTAEAVASGDFLAFVDSTDNGTHKETVDDLATLFAGNGLSAASAVMAVDLNELSAAAVDVAADSIAIIDANDSNGSRKESIADLMTAAAGVGISAASGVLALDINELTAMGGQLTPAADSLAMLDGTVSKKISMSNFAASIKAASNSGLVAASGQLTVSINDLGAGAVAVAADSIAILDADDNLSKKESIVDFVAGIAGAGLSASGGQLSVQGNAVASFGDEDATAAEGFNYGTATLTANRTLTLPAAPSVGDVIHIKAPPALGGFNLIISKAGSHTIDGHDTVRIESGDGAVSLVYAVANKWKLF